MKVYQINYDLRKQRNYDELYKKIQSYSNWCRPLESCWLVISDKSAVDIRNDLQTVLDADDGLLVTRLKGEAAWQKINSDQNNQMTNWLKDNLGKAS